MCLHISVLCLSVKDVWNFDAMMYDIVCSNKLTFYLNMCSY